MNELQIGMAGLGVAAVAGVFALNKWQERKQRRLAERVLERGHRDVLLGDAPAAAPAAATLAPGFAADSAARTDGAASVASAGDIDFSELEERFAATEGLADPGAEAADSSAAALAAIDGRIEPRLAVPETLEFVAVSISRETLADELNIAGDGTIAGECVAAAAGESGAAAASPAAHVAAPAASASPSPSRPVAAPAMPPASEPKVAPAAAPAPAPREMPSPAPAAVRESTPSALLLSPQIDYIAVIDAADPASAGQLLRSQREALARLRKPVRWLGCNERSREWEPLREDSGGEYRRLRVGLQLVDRRGPINDVELAVFQRAMQDLADELIAVVDLAPAQPALAAAASLDGFCADVDIQIGINVISQGLPFPGSKLRALAEAAGMALDAEGRFVRRDDDGQTLFILCNQESGGFPADGLKTLTTHGVTFLLDVPRVAHGERVFAQMLDLARRFAATLHGALVDDNRRPLAEGALEPIRRAIAQAQAAMAARQLPAGGALAQRLFA